MTPMTTTLMTMTLTDTAARTTDCVVVIAVWVRDVGTFGFRARGDGADYSHVRSTQASAGRQERAGEAQDGTPVPCV